MDEEEAKRPKGHEVGMMLDAMSVEELADRIAMLEAEIGRLRGAIEGSQQDANRRRRDLQVLITPDGRTESKCDRVKKWVLVNAQLTSLR